MPYSRNVFLNCPFDDTYRPMLKALVYTIIYLGYEPLISQTFSSSAIRINRIKAMIRNARYSIHDLSRSRPMKRNELPRFNMPYELGLDIGCYEYGGKKFSGKKILILEKERYHYQKVISDIAGQDIENHDDNPQILIKKTRNWFSANNPASFIPGQNEIWITYNQFNKQLYKQLSAAYKRSDIDEMPVGDYIKFTKDWIRSNRL